MTDKVTQAARDAAADLAEEVLSGWCHIGGNDVPAIRNGFWDDDQTDLGLLVKAFARFEEKVRTNTNAELVEALRPFIALANAVLSEAPPDATGWPAFDDCEGNEHVITMDQLRALTALSLYAKDGDER